MSAVDLDRVASRRAVEALRSGVPSQDAVRALGARQQEIERAFLERLGLARNGQTAGGVLFAGDFGTGKSHLLASLQYRAATEGFVTSKVVISKETPLHDPVKVFRTAVNAARAPGVRGPALDEIARRLVHERDALRSLRSWAEDSSAGLDDRFAATLFLFENARSDMELFDQIVRFWTGDPISIADVRRALKATGEASTYALARIGVRDLALQRFRFAVKLMAAAGCAGWVILFDELELIGHYSLLQRARSYAELVRWAQGFSTEPLHGIVSALAITEDFDGAVLVEKGDFERAPNRLRDRGTPEDLAAATRAESGMRLISRGRMHLEPPTGDDLRDAYERVKELHARAYAWNPPDLQWTKASVQEPMRRYIRSWIQQWDLRRLDPTYVADIETTEIETPYREDEALEEDVTDDNGVVNGS